MTSLDQAFAEYAASITPEPAQKGFLGAFVAGSFQIKVTTDPSLAWVRSKDHQQATAKHHGRVNLDTTEQDRPIELGFDENGDLAILGYDRDQAGAVYEGDPGASVTLPDVGVTPGSYTTANITVDQKGRVTAATNGTPSLALDDLTDVSTAGGSTGDVLTQQGDGSYAPEAPSGGGVLDVIHLQDQKAQGTASGTFTSGAWQTRDLNTEVVDTGNHCTLSSNQFALDAGTYRLWARAPAAAVNQHQCRIQNITDGTTELIGSAAYASSTNFSMTDSWVMGRFTISASKTFELQHRATTTRATNGYGSSAAFTTEIFSEVWIEKE